MGNSSYAEKLKDPKWQRKRLEILERDGWKCKFCGETEITLHVHHLFYLPKKEPWEYPNGFLLTICEDCHSNVNCEDVPPSDIILGELNIFLSTYWSCGYGPGDFCDFGYALSKNKLPKGSFTSSIDLVVSFRSNAA